MTAAAITATALAGLGLLTLGAALLAPAIGRRLHDAADRDTRPITTKGDAR